VTTDRDLCLCQPLDIDPNRLASIIGEWPGASLLESGPGFGPAGRWSILAAKPRFVFEATQNSWRIQSKGRPTQTGRGNSLDRLGDLLKEFNLAESAEYQPSQKYEAPFWGGMIGYFGYDLATRIENIPRKAGRDSRMPDIRFGLYDTAIIVDHSTNRAEFRAFDLMGEGISALHRRWEEWHKSLHVEETSLALAWLRSARSNFSKDEYINAVRKALEYIRAGDIFQVNLSQRFSCREVGSPICKPDPLNLYLRLKQNSPAPYAALIRWKDLAVISASPELFFETRGQQIVTRPIKGTRPRGTTPDEDARLIADLTSSPKDRAELTMIVDLERNDLGRVCEYGSVRVNNPMSLESYAQVHHLVATVEGNLRPTVGPIDVIRAVFPGGSITGAPKIRAMQIIDELEPTRRSIYTGAIGYYSRGGISCFNIAIRTMTVEGEQLHYQVGGGIVADSDPEAEYYETIHKGRGMRQVLEWQAGSPEAAG
jgi:para-aminobenzoate synthetase component 1